MLIKVLSSPINPSDFLYTKGLYITTKPSDSTPGFEGSGEVVQNGGGFLGWRLLGKKVAFVSGSESRNGAWQQYINVPAKICIDLSDVHED